MTQAHDPETLALAQANAAHARDALEAVAALPPVAGVAALLTAATSIIEAIYVQPHDRLRVLDQLLASTCAEWSDGIVTVTIQ